MKIYSVVKNAFHSFSVQKLFKKPKISLPPPLERDVVEFSNSTKLKNTDLAELFDSPVLTVLKTIKKAPFLGEGYTSKVYKYNGYALKVRKAECELTQPFREVVDDFEGLNVGQMVATNRVGVSVHRFVEGKPLYPDWMSISHKHEKISPRHVKNYVEELGRINNFSDEVLSDYAKMYKTIGERGYAVDSCNPNNFLYDAKANRINFVDLTKKDNEIQVDTCTDLVRGLVDDWNKDSLISHANLDTKKEIIGKIQNLYKKMENISLKEQILITPINPDNLGNLTNLELIGNIDLNKLDYGKIDIHNFRRMLIGAM